MATLLRMPEIAAAMTEAVIQEWKVAENATFTAGDTLAEIETDKAVIDFEADTDGIVLRLLAEAGVTIDVGAPIAVIGDTDEAGADVDALLVSLGVTDSTTTAAAGAFAQAPDQAGAVVPPDDTVVSVGAQGRIAPGPAVAGSGRAPAENPAAAGWAAPAGGNAAGSEANGPAPHRIFASPLARKMARESGLDLSTLTGTGPGGRIVRSDIDAALRHSTSAASEAPPAPALATNPPTETSPGVTPGTGPWTDEPHTRLRRAVAARLTQSKQQVPHFYLRRTARIDALLALRTQLNAAATTRISVNDLVVKAAVLAHRRVPAMNVIWTDDALRRYDDIDVSVAIAGDKGLVTPVIRAAQRLSISELSTTVKDFVARAGTGKLKQQELEGGSFSVTNLGMYGIDDFGAIINPPQSAILAVGAGRRTPAVDTHPDGTETLTIATTLQLTLSVDHRAVDGALAAQWFTALITTLENPLQILL
ncbi:2-oxo acid dehydrogenase subunit E2 [Nakamurella deserti]|uniref:2-oxo acid dehydrogenase subunit E2 n=1 Tax=Nakamurella deserti TaxID=2164074 RepID=UPI000DBE29AF|nr:2-oxo acid dehydrogenase subunit E2 [Nakamurella deserti]